MKELILVFYLIYMFRYFKTKISFTHPLEFLMMSKSLEYFKHSLTYGSYESKICPFGHDAIFVLVIFILFRWKFNFLNKVSKIMLVIVFIISLLNLNAVIYLIPYFIFELFLIK
jgi:hypothetical protein